MQTRQMDYIRILEHYLKHKQKMNPAYSLRSMAQSLGISPSTLSRILKGQRGLSLKLANIMIDKLKLDERHALEFLNSLKASKFKLLDKLPVGPEFQNSFEVDHKHYDVLSQWEYFALYDLIELDDFESSENYIAQKLSISVERTKKIIQEMVDLKLIKKDENGQLSQIVGPLKTSEDIHSRALQAAHLETLEKAKEKLLSIDVIQRDFSSILIPSDPKQLPIIKELIREFRKKVATTLKNGNKTQLYQLSIQLYPMTEMEQGETI